MGRPGKARLAFTPPDFRRSRSRSASAANAAFKAAARTHGRLSCAVCGFCDKRFPPHGLIETHHIRQRSAGGTNNSSNLINLCPTHHSAADRICRANPNLTRSQLIVLLGGSFPSCVISTNSVNSTKENSSMDEHEGRSPRGGVD
jgi:hypothetical protein